MLNMIRSHLTWKVFLSYVIVILVVIFVLVTATSLSVPAAFYRHMAGMSAMMPNQGMMGSSQSLEINLFSEYRSAATEAISLAAFAALVVAVLASILISRQVVEPIRRMMVISQRVADGEYDERLKGSSNLKAGQPDELDQLALSFNQMAEKLEKTELMRRQLIGDISHELRTPLTAIKGYMEGLMDGVLPASPETYQQVYAEADRLQRLVNDLQELSRVESGAQALTVRPVVPGDLVEQVVGHLKRQFEEKEISLETAVPGNLPLVMVDPDRIHQVLTDLVGNALQYTPTGGRVTISAAHDKDEVRITVADNGIGIAPDQLPKIFNRFYRVDKSRARASGGSGVGLTIAMAFVKAHHGRLWVESDGEGKGSTFHFTLPVVLDSPRPQTGVSG